MLRKDSKSEVKSLLTNRELADVMREIADRLQQAGESPFRVAAYRRAAATYARCPWI